MYEHIKSLEDMPKPPFPPGREQHELFGETKASKQRRKAYEEQSTEWEAKLYELVKKDRKRKLTLIELAEEKLNTNR
jgi:hypothetical protein